MSDKPVTCSTCGEIKGPDTCDKLKHDEWREKMRSIAIGEGVRITRP